MDRRALRDRSGGRGAGVSARHAREDDWHTTLAALTIMEMQAKNVSETCSTDRGHRRVFILATAITDG